jgi:hypothetical protein
VEVSEHIEPSAAAAVVEFALRQHAQQGRLADVEAAEHGHAEIDVLLVVRNLRAGCRRLQRFLEARKIFFILQKRYVICCVVIFYSAGVVNHNRWIGFS